MLPGLLLVALAAVLWGTTGTTLELVGATSSAVPLVVGGVRMLVAAPLLGGGAVAARASLRPRGWGFVGAGLCMAAYQVCYFSAVPLAGVAATALLAICSAPILIAVLARLALNERLTTVRLVALALGVAGAGMLVGGGQAAAGARFVAGCALALGAGLAYSLYAVITKRALTGTAGQQPVALSALTFSVAAVALLPALALQPAVTVATIQRGWPLLLWLAAVPTAAAYWLYTTGLRRVPAGVAAIAGLLEPMTATALGVIVFREALGPVAFAGAVLLLIAMVVLGGTARKLDAHQ